MNKQDHIDTLANWTKPENLEPLPFWQALAMHLAFCAILCIPFIAILLAIYVAVAP